MMTAVLAFVVSSGYSALLPRVPCVFIWNLPVVQFLVQKFRCANLVLPDSDALRAR